MALDLCSDLAMFFFFDNRGPFGGHPKSVGIQVHQSLLRWFPVQFHFEDREKRPKKDEGKGRRNLGWTDLGSLAGGPALKRIFGVWTCFLGEGPVCSDRWIVTGLFCPEVWGPKRREPA